AAGPRPPCVPAACPTHAGGPLSEAASRAAAVGWISHTGRTRPWATDTALAATSRYHGSGFGCAETVSATYHAIFSATGSPGCSSSVAIGRRRQERFPTDTWTGARPSLAVHGM